MYVITVSCGANSHILGSADTSTHLQKHSYLRCIQYVKKLFTHCEKIKLLTLKVKIKSSLHT